VCVCVNGVWVVTGVKVKCGASPLFPSFQVINAEMSGLSECRPLVVFREIARPRHRRPPRPVWVQDNTLCLPIGRELCGQER
jgi:hypothetical protein